MFVRGVSVIVELKLSLNIILKLLH